MGRFFYLTKRAKKIKNRNTKIKFRWNPKFASFACLSVLVSVFIFYIVQINSLATKGYQIKELEQKISGLKEISREFEDRILTLQSAGNVEEKVKNLNLVEATDVERLFFSQKEVALKAN